ncbi:MAG: methyltransferase domain-containing protein [Armatimonadetes bacterium]|nr:methyltransferase domain-containing protein [Armatimonadota bacterium]
MALVPEAEEHYALGHEQERLLSGSGRIEFLRTLSIISRHLPSTGLRIVDVGGGTGPYALELARQGHVVDLIDAMPLHIEQALGHPDSPLLASATVGDARALPSPDGSVDAVLMLGPLYHLTELSDRALALREANRVLKPGGLLFVAAISKHASLFDGYFRGMISDPVFQGIVEQDLLDGQHRNPTGHPQYFTTTKFHTAAELASELSGAGFADEKLFGVEGFSWLLPTLDDVDLSPSGLLMRHLEAVEREESILGMSAHLLAVAKKA